MKLSLDELVKLGEMFPRAKIEGAGENNGIAEKRVKITKPGIRLEIGDKSFSKTWVRTPAGGMKQHNCTRSTQGLLEEAKNCQKFFNEFTPPPLPLRSSAVIKRLPFITKASKYFDDTTVSRRVPQVMRIFRVSLVSIKKDDKDDKKLYKLTCHETPKDHDVVYLVECYNTLGATFDIITDAKTYYVPCDRYRARLTNNLAPKKSVDLSSLTQEDLGLIEFALEKLPLNFEKGVEN